MPAVATTINARLVLNGSQYASEMERMGRLTSRSVRDIEKTQARITEERRARAMVGKEGPERQRLAAGFAEEDALAEASKRFDKIKRDTMTSFRKAYAGTDSMESRMQLAADARQAIAAARARYAEETAAVRARYAAERAEIARTAAASKAAARSAAIDQRAGEVARQMRQERSFSDPAYTGLHGYRRAQMPGRGGKGEAFSFEKARSPG